MALYRFILTPLGKLYFGGEKSPFKEEYYLKTRLFPQQTGLLGFLRHQILIRSGEIEKRNKTRWKELIGEESFNAQPSQTFGIIQRLSPLSIYFKAQKKELFFYRNPNELQPLQISEGITVDYGEGQSPRNDIIHFHTTNGTHYSPKNEAHFRETLSDFNGTTTTIQTNDVPLKKSNAVFQKSVKVGITKNYAGDPQQESFFKIEYFQMNTGYAYSFLAEIDDCPEINQWQGTSFVQLGGDTSNFRLDVEPIGINDWYDNSTNNGNVFILLSDAMAVNSVYEHCSSVIADTLTFRNLKTAVKDQHFTKRPVRKWYDKNKSFDAYEGRILLKRGSILIADQNKENLLEQALDYPAFYKIGYNYFKRFNQLP